METAFKILTASDLKDFTDLLNVFKTTFEMKGFPKPEETHLHTLISRNDFKAVVAKKENIVVGGLTIYILDQYYSKKPLAYIYDLAILPDYQRQGIGKGLIEFLVRYCKENRFEEVFVQADKVDDHAIDFYRKTNPTSEEECLQFSYRL
jgi:aminoglycoside 3-N-acetyltransferase I